METQLCKLLVSAEKKAMALHSATLVAFSKIGAALGRLANSNVPMPKQIFQWHVLELRYNRGNDPNMNKLERFKAKYFFVGVY